MNGKQFENQREIYQALLDGKKVISCNENDITEGRYVYLNGRVYYSDGDIAHLSFCYPHEWSLYEEPRQYEKWYRCLVRSFVKATAHIEYRKCTDEECVLKVYDDYILVDENKKLVEESK